MCGPGVGHKLPLMAVDFQAGYARGSNAAAKGELTQQCRLGITLRFTPMSLKFTREWMAALCLAVGAASPIASWYLLLFEAKPDNVSTANAALQEIAYVFSSADPNRWWFCLWTALPIVLLADSATCAFVRPFTVRARRLVMLSLLVIAVAAPFLWPQELLPMICAIFLIYPPRERSVAVG